VLRQDNGGAGRCVRATYATNRAAGRRQQAHSKSRKLGYEPQIGLEAKWEPGES